MLKNAYFYEKNCKRTLSIGGSAPNSRFLPALRAGLVEPEDNISPQDNIKNHYFLQNF